MMCVYIIIIPTRESNVEGSIIVVTGEQLSQASSKAYLKCLRVNYGNFDQNIKGNRVALINLKYHLRVWI